MKKLAIPLTILILIVLYANIDRPALLQQLSRIDVVFFLLALSCFVPQILVAAWRWRWMVWDFCLLDIGESAKLILASKTLNALVPSKLGEMSKAYFLKTHFEVGLSQGMVLVLMEKILDVAGLCVVLLVGMLLAPQKGPVETLAILAALFYISVVVGIFTFRASWVRRWIRGKRAFWRRLVEFVTDWDEVLARWKTHRRRLVGILGLSCLLWFLHLAQIYVFFVTLHSAVRAHIVFAYVPIGIFVGLLPFTIGGMGARDSALVVLFAPYEDATVMAGIGILCAMRYWVDTLMGLPFSHHYSFGKH